MRAARLLLEPPDHAGLALYRYLKEHDASKQAARALLDSIAARPIAKVYKSAFERWKAALSGAVFLEATARTPLAIGLGNASPIENGLSIHHTYGTPYLPGSALKGLMARAARHYGLDEHQQEILLGTTQNAAHLIYWDGWLDPSSHQPFQKDVITVHHPDYYSGGQRWPTDFDDPNPVGFLSVKPGTKFCLALSSSSENATDWLYTAAEILRWGLEHLGLGGKTNAGYGYFTCKEKVSPEQEAINQAKAQALLEEYSPRISKITNHGSANLASKIARELESTRPEIRRPTLERVKQQLENHGLWRDDKDYTQKIKELLEES